MENFDKIITQLNFVNYFSLSTKGIKKEANEVMSILRKSLEIVSDDSSFYKVIASQVRLLICDKNNSLLLKLINEPFLPCISSYYISLDGEFNYHDKEQLFDYSKDFLNLDKWLDQKLMFYKRIGNWLPQYLNEDFYMQLMRGIKDKNIKQIFERLYEKVNGTFNQKEMYLYKLKTDIEDNDSKEVCNALDKIGYNSISIYDYIKLYGDKSGSHIDRDRPIGMMMVKPQDHYNNYLVQIAKLLIEEFEALTY